jgi:hypothetical protein
MPSPPYCAELDAAMAQYNPDIRLGAVVQAYPLWWPSLAVGDIIHHLVTIAQLDGAVDRDVVALAVCNPLFCATFTICETRHQFIQAECPRSEKAPPHCSCAFHNDLCCGPPPYGLEL